MLCWVFASRGAGVVADRLRGLRHGLRAACISLLSDCSTLRAESWISALQFLQFVELHFAVDVGLHVADVTLQASEQVPGRARHLRQPLGTDHHQRDDGDDDHLGKADIKHWPSVRNKR
jgi:hypothetical protein